MKKHSKDTSNIREFEQKADMLNRLMFALTEQRLNASPQPPTPVSLSLADAAMAVQAAIHTFIILERLQDQ